MNNDTKKVNTQNPHEEEALIALRKRASDSLESDLLASAMASGLDQVFFFCGPSCWSRCCIVVRRLPMLPHVGTYFESFALCVRCLCMEASAY